MVSPCFQSLAHFGGELALERSWSFPRLERKKIGTAERPQPACRRNVHLPHGRRQTRRSRPSFSPRVPASQSGGSCPPERPLARDRMAAPGGSGPRAPRSTLGTRAWSVVWSCLVTSGLVSDAALTLFLHATLSPTPPWRHDMLGLTLVLLATSAQTPEETEPILQPWEIALAVGGGTIALLLVAYAIYAGRRRAAQPDVEQGVTKPAASATKPAASATKPAASATKPAARRDQARRPPRPSPPPPRPSPPPPRPSPPPPRPSLWPRKLPRWSRKPRRLRRPRRKPARHLPRRRQRIRSTRR